MYVYLSSSPDPEPCTEQQLLHELTEHLPPIRSIHHIANKIKHTRYQLNTQVLCRHLQLIRGIGKKNNTTL